MCPMPVRGGTAARLAVLGDLQAPSSQQAVVEAVEAVEELEVEVVVEC